MVFGASFTPKTRGVGDVTQTRGESVYSTFHFIITSKNTGNTAFRKLNVNSDDEIDEDVGDGEVQGPNEGEVTALLNQYPFNFLD